MHRTRVLKTKYLFPDAFANYWEYLNLSNASFNIRIRQYTKVRNHSNFLATSHPPPREITINTYHCKITTIQSARNQMKTRTEHVC